MSAPFLSIVIPFKNSLATFDECLRALHASEYRDFEVICVDDGTTDGSEKLPDQYGFTHLRNPRQGVASARNQGAQAARGTLLFFIDSDVMVFPTTLGHLVDHFQKEGLDGMVGLQSLLFRFNDFPSRFKNLWMHFTYVRLPGQELSLFYTTVAAIRREVFSTAGGFDEAFRTPNVEDTVFGHQLKAKGARILLGRNVQVEHVRPYSLTELLQTDVNRSRCLTAFSLGRGFEKFKEGNTTSVPGGYMLSTVLGPLGWLSMAGAVLGLTGWGWVAGMALGFTFVNWEFLTFVKAVEGVRFALKAWLFLWVDILAVDVGIALGFWDGIRGSPYVRRGQSLAGGRLTPGEP